MNLNDPTDPNLGINVVYHFAGKRVREELTDFSLPVDIPARAREFGLEANVRRVDWFVLVTNATNGTARVIDGGRWRRSEDGPPVIDN